MTSHDAPAGNPRRRRAEMALLCAAAFWGLSFPLVKTVTLLHGRLAPGESGWFLTACAIWPRFFLALLILVPLAGRGLRRLTRLEVVQGAGLGLFMSAGLVFQVDGLRHTEASTSAFLSQFYVLFLPVAVFGRRRRWPPPRFILGTLFVLGGVAILADLDLRVLHIGRGELETLVSTVFFAGQILWLERPLFRDNRPIPVTAVMFGVTFLVFASGALLLASEPGAMLVPAQSGPWLGFTALLAVVCSVGAMTLMNTYQPCLNAAEAGIIYATEPLWASLMALFLPAWFSFLGGLDYPNEVITWRLLAGGSLIFAANAIIQLKPPVPPAAAVAAGGGG